jgi:mannobiose 2-epimerase
MRAHASRILLAVVCLASLPPAARAQDAATAPFDYKSPSRDVYLRFADETEAALRMDVLGVWFPRTVDTEHGGFRANFERDWSPAPSEGKFSVFEGRMTWVAAKVALRYPDLRERYLPFVRHGLDYLETRLWDAERGGFYWGLGDDGRVNDRFTDGKHLYGMSFCIYGAAAAYEATRDPRALELAKRGFAWIDAHAHDATNGGYHEWLTREGRVVAARPPDVRGDLVPVAGFPVGFKSMNTHIHLMEAFTELYGVWPDPTLRARLAELLEIVRDRVSVEPGAMGLYFTPDWRAVPGHDSYGHDVETAYLMIETAEAIGRKADAKTERMARMLVDHALAYGWDEQYGGFYREGTSFAEAEDTTKEWWEQVEGLNALLLMHERYRRETGVYWKAFQRQWAFLRDRQTDRAYRGLFEAVKRDGTPVTFRKAHIWKAAYHDGRAFMNVAERLRRLALGASGT